MSFLTTILIATMTLPLWLKIVLSFLGGVIPVFIWLWFWEHEGKHPEPIKLTAYAFIAGMVSVIAALFLEQQVAANVTDFNTTIFLWAAIEELLKFGAAYFIVLRRAENHEPIDSMMYMITAALGFSALENALFLFKPIYEGHIIQAFMTGNFRFIGATLLHTITSGIIGLSLALTFYKSRRAKIIVRTIGVIIAIVLHTLFNLSIMKLGGSNPILPFYAVWLAVVAILLAFEKVKGLQS